MTSSDPTVTDKAQLSQSWTDTLTRTLPKSSDSICISKVITRVVSASPYISFKLFNTKLLCHQSVLFFLLLMQTNPLSCLPSDILSLSFVGQHPGNTFRTIVQKIFTCTSIWTHKPIFFQLSFPGYYNKLL